MAWSSLMVQLDNNSYNNPLSHFQCSSDQIFRFCTAHKDSSTQGTRRSVGVRKSRSQALFVSSVFLNLSVSLVGLIVVKTIQIQGAAGTLPLIRDIRNIQGWSGLQPCWPPLPGLLTHTQTHGCV